MNAFLECSVWIPISIRRNTPDKWDTHFLRTRWRALQQNKPPFGLTAGLVDGKHSIRYRHSVEELARFGEAMYATSLDVTSRQWLHQHLRSLSIPLMDRQIDGLIDFWILVGNACTIDIAHETVQPTAMQQVGCLKKCSIVFLSMVGLDKHWHHKVNRLN